MKPLSEADYIVLACIASETDGDAVVPLRDVLNRNGAANWTVCPRCSVDDFSHTETCGLRNCVAGLESPAIERLVVSGKLDGYKLSDNTGDIGVGLGHHETVETFPTK